MRLRHATKGFTIVELMIATTVFSAVLLLISLGLVNIGRMFFKSVNIVNTQEVARSIIEDISQAIQFSGEDVATSIAPAADGSLGFCVGARRYSYVLGRQLVDGAAATTETSPHVLVADTLPSGTCNAATVAQQVTQPGLAPGSRELMGPGARLAVMDVAANAFMTGLYNIRIRVVFGDPDVVTPDWQNCRDNRLDATYCATADLTTSVQRRIQ